MNIVKRLPSHLAQYVFAYDDTCSKLYRIVMMQLLFYSLFNLNAISNINHWRPSQYSLNKKKITHGIKQFIKDTNDEFDINMIENLRKEVPKLYKSLKKAPRGDTLFQPSRSIIFCNFRDYLSFQKYSCVNHYHEFVYYNCACNDFMSLALILNGYPYKFNVKRWPKLEINAHYTEFYYDMYRDYLHKKKCNCKYRRSR